MPSHPSRQASRNTISPSSSKCSLRTMLKCDLLSNLASNRLRFSIGSRRKIPSVKLKQIERAMHGALECAVAADQIKDRKPVLVANDGLAVDQARAYRKLADRRCDEREARRVESASDVMRRIIRSRDGRPCRRRLLSTPLPDRRTLLWQQDRWPVQPIPSTLWLGLASKSARACDHVQRWPSPSPQTTQYAYKSAQVWHGGALAGEGETRTARREAVVSSAAPG
jgi:hypothetical protein